MATLAYMERVCEVRLSQCVRVGDAALATFLRAHRHATHLALGGLLGVDHAFMELAQFPAITSLNLYPTFLNSYS